MELLKVKKINIDQDTRDAIEDMFSSVKSDDEVMKAVASLGINNEQVLRKNIATIFTFKEDLDYCRKCPGYDACAKDHPHYRFKLRYDGSFLSNHIEACHLKIEDMRKDEAYVARDFPASWRSSNTTNIDGSTVRIKLIKRYQEALKSPQNWIYITGSHRSGKSYVAASLINTYILKNHQKVAFINYPIRVRKLNDLSYSDKEMFFKYLDLFSNVEVLVLDDFGNEYKNEYIRDSITIQLLNERARKGLMTIFTSSFDFNEIANMYAINSAGRTRGNQIKRMLEDYAIEPIDISCAKIY